MAMKKEKAKEILARASFRKIVIQAFGDYATMQGDEKHPRLSEFLFDKLYESHKKCGLLTRDMAEALSKIGDLELEVGRGGL
jgi:hypothetical protein